MPDKYVSDILYLKFHPAHMMKARPSKPIEIEKFLEQVYKDISKAQEMGDEQICVPIGGLSDKEVQAATKFLNHKEYGTTVRNKELIIAW
jgi:hypothetical protein